MHVFLLLNIYIYIYMYVCVCVYRAILMAEHAG